MTGRLTIMLVKLLIYFFILIIKKKLCTFLKIYIFPIFGLLIVKISKLSNKENIEIKTNTYNKYKNST